MSKQRRVKSDDAKMNDQGFLSRWSARKTQISRAEGIQKDDPQQQSEADAAGADQESNEEAALTDIELLNKYKLPDPNDITEEAGLDRFFDGKIPERLKQMALRRLWRINPLFGIVDEMVEYGEDYTDAATVIDGMQTAYQAGKGYLNKVIEGNEEDEGGENSDSQMDQDDQADLELDGNNELQKSELKNQNDTGVENRERVGGAAEQEFTRSSSADDSSLQLNASVKTSSGDKNWGEVSHLESSVLEDESKSVSEPTEKNSTIIKPKRMQFRINS